MKLFRFVFFSIIFCLIFNDFIDPNDVHELSGQTKNIFEVDNV